MPLYFPLVPSGSTENVEAVPGATGATGPAGPSGSAGTSGLNRGPGPLFGTDNVLGNQSLLTLGVLGLGSLPFVAPRSGSVTGLSMAASVAPTGSAINVAIYSGGSSLLTASLAAGSYSGSITFSPGSFTFGAGAALSARYTTGLLWASPLTTFVVYLEVST